MEIRFHYPALILVGAVILGLAILLTFLFRRKKTEQGGVRVANTARVRSLPIYKKMQRLARIFRIVLVAALSASVLLSLVLTARPYTRDTVKEDVTRRDIFLCLDLSATNYKMNLELVKGMRTMVEGMTGDRIGISLFNTSSSLYLPETDDYDYALQRMDELQAYLEAEEQFVTKFTDKYENVYDIPDSERQEFMELNEKLTAFDKGTTTGYESKGTSVIGEGLASCLFDFPGIREEERTRVILFATDNADQCDGDPLVTLEKAASMCADDKVVVFAIFPGEDLERVDLAMPAAEDEEETASIPAHAERRDSLKQAAESTGGVLYEMTDGFPASEILKSIEGQKAMQTQKVTSTRDSDQPRFFFILLVIAVGFFVLVQTYLLVNTFRRAKKYGKVYKNAEKRKGIRGIPSAIIRLAALLTVIALVVMTGLRPLVMKRGTQNECTNLDVCFVVDSTISMWAEDFNGDQERMTGVKKDINYIMSQLPGSNFALIRFDNGSQVLAPFTQDVNSIKKSMRKLDMPAVASATGSSLNTAYDDLASMLDSSHKKSGRRTIVFFMSDGEITDGSTLTSFENLRDKISDGAVLGYGTKEGGRMRYAKNKYVPNATTGKDARSVIDEKNLRQIADDLGIDYMHRTALDYTSLHASMERIQMMSFVSAMSSGGDVLYDETYYYFAGALAILLGIWLCITIRKGGVA